MKISSVLAAILFFFSASSFPVEYEQVKEITLGPVLAVGNDNIRNADFVSALRQFVTLEYKDIRLSELVVLKISEKLYRGEPKDFEFGFGDDTDNTIISIKARDVRLVDVFKAIAIEYKIDFDLQPGGITVKKGKGVLTGVISLRNKDVLTVPGLQNKVNLNFQDTPVKDILRYFAEEMKLNLVFDDCSDKKVSLRINQTTLLGALKALAEISDARLDVKDGVILFGQKSASKSSKMTVSLSNGLSFEYPVDNDLLDSDLLYHLEEKFPLLLDAKLATIYYRRMRDNLYPTVSYSRKKKDNKPDGQKPPAAKAKRLFGDDDDDFGAPAAVTKKAEVQPVDKKKDPDVF